MHVYVQSPYPQHLRCRLPCQCRLAAFFLLFVKSTRHPSNLKILPTRLHLIPSSIVRSHSDQPFSAGRVYRGHSQVVRLRRHFHWACPCHRRHRSRRLATYSFPCGSSDVEAIDSVHIDQFKSL